MNSLILAFHVTAVCGLSLFALRFGKELMIAWLSLLAVAMNLFVLKQVTLFGLSVTASDALGVGYLLGLNLIQEFFGQKTARRSVWISLFISASFVLLSQIHLAYTPNRYDLAQSHFLFLFTPLARLILASLFSFLVVQLVDLAFFRFLRKKMSGKYLTLRTTLALVLSQTLDTLLFSFLGLYRLVPHIGDIILFSLVVKGVVILFSTPFVYLSKQVAGHEV
ncbi:MAG: queuosine precursor transporter [Chlamydiales bacterium]|nr:queuosine precursor transporter [Chlamydiales bacterium]